MWNDDNKMKTKSRVKAWALAALFYAHTNQNQQMIV